MPVLRIENPKSIEVAAELVRGKINELANKKKDWQSMIASLGFNYSEI